MRVSLRLLCCSVIALSLHACTAPTAKPEESYRVLNRVEVPLRVGVGAADDQPFRREFEQRDVKGSISDSGRWNIEKVVDHSRFRCGIYEVGIQLGSGTSTCSQPTWMNEPAYGTRERQCNSASKIHAGVGTLPIRCLLVAHQGEFQRRDVLAPGL